MPPSDARATRAERAGVGASGAGSDIGVAGSSGRYVSSAMCGRFTLTTSAAEVAEHFGLDAVPELAPRYNIAPTQSVPVIRAYRLSGEEGGRVLELRYWGLVPRWSKDASGAARMINARSETAAEKPAFRDALQSRRCLVPMDGFYEWKQGPKRRGGAAKRPHYIQLAQGELFAVAGLYDSWRSPDGQDLESVTLLTRAACESLRGLHHRMPVVVAPGGYSAWLDVDVEGDERTLKAIDPERGRGLRPRPVSYRVNSVAHDDAACLDGPDAVQLSLLGDDEL